MVLRGHRGRVTTLVAIGIACLAQVPACGGRLGTTPAEAADGGPQGSTDDVSAIVDSSADGGPQGSTDDASAIVDSSVDGGPEGSTDDASAIVDSGSDADTGAPDVPCPPWDSGPGGCLLLQAFGGTAGEVAAQIPNLEPGAGLQQTCAAPVDAGACQLTSCMLGGIGTPGPGYGNFGPMSASVGTTTVALTYDGFGYPTVDFPSSVTLGAGGTMTFRGGNGADVPSFDVSAIIPGLGVITSPVPTTDGGAPIIDTSQDLTVTWLPISIGQIKFGLDGGDPLGTRTAVTVACTFDGASGSGVVARALLSSLRATSGANPVYLSLSSELDATTVVDGLTIVTQSFQYPSPTSRWTFDVRLE